MAPPNPKATSPRADDFNLTAGFLSYLVPGLGQMATGRVGKGVLFLLCIYFLFFFGTYLGSGTVRIGDKEYRVTSNVYLPDSADRNNPFNLPRTPANLVSRLPFLGQFWAGIVAWPAIWQYANAGERPDEHGDPLFGNFEKAPSDEALNALHTTGDKLIDLGLVYTIIAGVLNILVIYDAAAGPAFSPARKENPVKGVPENQEAAA